MKKVEKSSFAGTEAEQRIADDNSTSASLLPNTVLSAALSVEEGNKLIGEFMNHPFIKKWKRYNYKGEFPYKDLKYHSSWDWLMPVYIRFKNIKSKDKIFNHYHIQVCRSFEAGILSGDIENAFNDAVMAIKWYKNNAVSVGSS